MLSHAFCLCCVTSSRQFKFKFKILVLLLFLRWGITWNMLIPAPTSVPSKWNQHRREYLINIMWIEALLCHSCGFDFPNKEMRMGLSCCGRLFRWISCKFLCCCYLNAVALPDRRPHGQRGRRYAANTVQQRQAGTRSHRVGHLTGEQREAAQGKATCAHAIGQLTQLLFFVHLFTFVHLLDKVWSSVLVL